MSAKNILPLIPLPIMSMGCFSFTGVDLEIDLHWEGETYDGYRLPYTYSYGGYYYSYHQLFLDIDEDSEVMLLSSFYFHSDSSYDYNYGGCISYLLSFEKDSSTSYQIESLDGEDAIDCTLKGRRLQYTMNGGMSFKRADYAFNSDATLKKMYQRHN